jgi:Reverse transcriptase (RNA-dependent DNA polymerase)
VNVIIYGSTNIIFIEEFLFLMHSEFEMSMMEELSVFLRLQIKQMKDIIFVSQTKYVKDLLKHFGVNDSKSSKTSMEVNVTV